jgi:hypothetical protein
MANLNANPDPLVPTRMITTTTTLEGTPAAAEIPEPAGIAPEEVADLEREANAPPATGPGIEGEQVVWEGRYSLKNFLARITLRVVLTVAWLALAVATWGNGSADLAPLTIILGIVLVFLWLTLLYRIAQARFGHFYRLTNRRLFVSTGLWRRRLDQMEVLRIKDVFTRQTLIERWLSLGTVVVVSGEEALPVLYLSGVSDANEVMDLIWHCARSERDHRSTNIQSV